MTSDIQYPDHFIERLHAVWGHGFLSPGGEDEVKEIVKRLDLSGKTVLDVGFGTGGPAIVLAGTLGAAHVVGVDIEAPLHARATKNVEAAGLADRITLNLIEPGPLPFEAGSFDVVFSKDSIIHITDKQAFFAEVLRVLKPDGVFAASDWLRGTGPAAEKALAEMAAASSHLHFEMASAQEMEAALTQAGFQEVASIDRNAWYAGLVEDEMQQLTGPLYDDLVAKVGRDIVDPWLNVRRALANATLGGGLRPTHLFGTKPAV